MVEGLDPAVEAGQARELVVQLGTAMSAAGDSVDAIHGKLEQVMAALGFDDFEVVVFPTALFVETGYGPTARVQLGSELGTSLRFDQTAVLYDLIRDVIAGDVDATTGLVRLEAIRRMRPRFRWPERTLGHALLTLGLALLLQPTPATLAACFALGLLIGLLKLPRLPTLQLIFPVVASFLVGVIVLESTKHLHIDNPVRILVPPLVTFLPGGALTTGTQELAAGEMIAGASRLVSGLVQLLLLTFGILAAASIVGAPLALLRDNPPNRIGWWAPILGIAMLLLGTYLHFGAPARALPWIAAVLVVAYGGQRLGGLAFGGALSGFFGALAMTPLVLWFDRLPKGPPKLVTFLPGFWLLVPGATALIGVTGIAGASRNGAEAFATALVTVLSISLGVLIGTAAYRTFDASAQRVSKVIGPYRG